MSRCRILDEHNDTPVTASKPMEFFVDATLVLQRLPIVAKKCKPQ